MRFPRGKVVALIGGSGSGKTTILRLIGGLLRPSRGPVVFDGQDVHTLDRDGALRFCAGAWACCTSSARCSPT